MDCNSLHELGMKLKHPTHAYRKRWSHDDRVKHHSLHAFGKSFDHRLCCRIRILWFDGLDLLKIGYQEKEGQVRLLPDACEQATPLLIRVLGAFVHANKVELSQC